MFNISTTSLDFRTSDDAPIRPFPAVDSAENLLQLAEDKSSKKRKGDAPPRKKRGKDPSSGSASATAYEPPVNADEGEELDLESGIDRKGEYGRGTNGDDADEEELEEMNRRDTKSVRWSDHTDGGELSQFAVALSYNRKQLSYQPRSKIKFGIWSPLQKKILIGVGIAIFIILAVLFGVVFGVVKPSSKTQSPPTAPPPTAPFSRTPTAPIASPTAPPA